MPLAIRWEAKVKSGRVVDDFVLLKFYRLRADISGSRRRVHMPAYGRSLLGILTS